MRRRILVSVVALTMTAILSIISGSAWGQDHGVGCDGYEGDHGRGCLPVIDDVCEDSRWQPFDIFKNLFGNQDWCVYFTEQGSTHYDSY